MLSSIAASVHARLIRAVFKLDSICGCPVHVRPASASTQAGMGIEVRQYLCLFAEDSPPPPPPFLTFLRCSRKQ